MADEMPPGRLQDASLDGSIAVVGAGSIGGAWAIVFARAGYRVRLHDRQSGRLEGALDIIAARLDEMAGCGLLSQSAAVVGARIQPTLELAECLDGVVYVQECVPEDADLKRRLFVDLDRLAPRHAVLASSSSAIAISKVAAELAGRDRCMVVHPGNPPYLIPVAEIVPAPWTSRESVDAAQARLEAAGMLAIRVRREIEGFVFNRLQGALLREAYCLVRDGIAQVDEIDAIVREGLGLRWSVIGPFETADLNTRGGIAAHAALLGPAYARMGAERGQDDPWTDELVEHVTHARRRRLPLDQWADRVAWRDKKLMQLAQFRRYRTAGSADG
jgi:L-gulonate 3-dehydrogenase